MTRTLSLIAGGLMAVLPGAARAGTVPGQPQHPPSAPQHHAPRAASPLLYVRLLAPAGTQVKVFAGDAAGLSYNAPVTVGLRPGYVYRVQLTNLPGYPGATLAPSLEIRGTLQLPADMNPADHPTPVVFSQDDIDRALLGGLIAKVIYLEHPEKALPVPTRPDAPFEVDVKPTVNALDEVRAYGRPVAVARVGGREFDEAELARCAVPNTVLAPGATGLGMPAAPPHLPWACWPVYDSRLGPRPPEEECLHDGGDVGTRVGFGAGGRVFGVDPTDTVAEYADSTGRRKLAVSNRICICVPRFGVLRSETLPVGTAGVSVLNQALGSRVQGQMLARQPGVETRQYDQLQAAQARQRPTGAAASVAINVASQLVGNAILSGTYKGQEIAGVLVKPDQPPPDQPLCLKKWADRHSAQIGDVLTFTLEYSNRGGQPITNVALMDSLTTRLEYVPGSARSDRPVTFTTQPNAAGSSVLRWEVSGSLLPGQIGVVTFQARVR